MVAIPKHITISSTIRYPTKVQPIPDKQDKLASRLTRNTRFSNHENKRDNKLIQYIHSLRLKDHAILFYPTENSKLKMLSPFLEVGLSKGEAVIYLAPEHKLDRETRQIQGYDINLDLKQAFTILSADEWYLRKGKARPETIIANLLTLHKENQKRGFTGTRIAGDIEVFFNHAKTAELLRYEKLLGRQFATKICALCLYDIRRLDENQLTQVIKCHGHIISQGVIGRTSV